MRTSPDAPPTALPDADVIRAAVRTPAVFAVIFDRYHPTVHRYLARRVGSQAADDLASETFTRALAAVAFFDGDQPSARPWLLGIATNLVHRHHRDEVRHLRAITRSGAASMVDHGEDMASRVDTRVTAGACSTALVRALLTLKTADRDTLLLFAWEQLAYQEIADVLGIPVGTVRSRLNRARKRLRHDLGPFDTGSTFKEPTRDW